MGRAVLACQSGIWKGASSPASYVYTSQTYAGSASLVNTYGKNLFVAASGGYQNPYCGNNNYDLNAYVDGVWIASSTNNNQSYAKSGFLSFIVPPGSSYTVTSAPYNCGIGLIVLSAATF